MKRKGMIIFVLCAGIQFCAAQSGKSFSIGAVADLPVAKKLTYDFGAGGEASFTFGSKSSVAATINIAYLRYQFKDYFFPSGAPAAFYKKNFSSFYRFTGGIDKKLNEKLFINVQAGFTADVDERLSENVQPVIMAGPAIVLPVGTHNNLRFHASFGYYTGVFVSAEVAFGFRL